MRAKHLARHLERTITGPMWHGPSLDDALKDVTHERAAARPIAGGHSIWELVLHAAAWAEIARARMKGERTGDPTPEEDWPPIGDTGAGAWSAALERLRASHRALAGDVRAMREETLDAKVPGLDYAAAILLHGVVEHSTYHAGQISLLRKA